MISAPTRTGGCRFAAGLTLRINLPPRGGSWTFSQGPLRLYPSAAPGASANKYQETATAPSQSRAPDADRHGLWNHFHRLDIRFRHKSRLTKTLPHLIGHV